MFSFVLCTTGYFTGLAVAQNPELQQRVAEVKESSAKNKQALASYTWNETVTISLKGEQKKQEHFQVRLGPDLKPQKTPLDPPAEAAAPSGGRLKQHVVAKKKEEYKEYADAMKALAQQYVPPDKDLLQQAYAKGNITLGPAAGDPNELQLVIHNYLKPQDSMTLVFDKTQESPLASENCFLYGRPQGCDDLDGNVCGPAGWNKPCLQSDYRRRQQAIEYCYSEFELPARVSFELSAS